MKKLLAVIALVGLAGCASVTDLTSSNPNLELTSTQPVASLANCIKSAWSDVTAVNEANIADGGVRLIAPTGAGPLGIADLTLQGKSSRVVYYQSGQNFGYAQSKLRNGILSCK